MQDKQLTAYLKKSFLSGTAKNVVVMCTVLLLLPLIVSEIGMDQYGLVMMPMIFGGIATFADFGISKAVTYNLVKAESEKLKNTVLSAGLALNALVVLLIGIVVLIIIVLDFPVFGSSLKIDAGLVSYILVLGYATVAVLLLNNLLCAVLEAYYLQHYINIGFAFSSIGLHCLLYLFGLAFDSLQLLMLAPLLAFLSVSVYYVILIKTRTGVRPGSMCLKDFTSISRYGFQFFQISALTTLVIPGNKYLLVLLSGSPTVLAIFDIALKIGLMAASTMNSISQPLFAVFSNKDMSRSHVYLYSLRVSVVLFLMLIVGLAAYYYLGMTISGYIDQENAELIYRVSTVLIIGLGVNACAEPFFRALLGAGALRQARTLKLLIPVINVLVLYILLSNDVLISMSVSYAVALALSGMVLIGYFLKNFKRISGDMA